MNMIEQLGGYEETVKFRDLKQSEIDGCIPRSTRLYSHDFGLFEWGSLLDCLLEYRSQHGIFEIGDKVVSTLSGNEFWMEVVCTIEGFHKKMIITNGGGHSIHHYDFRHATDSEIAKGKRDEND